MDYKSGAKDMRACSDVGNPFCLPMFVALSLFLNFQNLFADETIPPFTAEGTIITEVFQKDGPISKIQQKAFFSYSNGWWELECRFETGYDKYIPSNALAGRVINCKRIPDGTRMFVTRVNESGPILASNVLQSAIVEPIPMPSPGAPDLLLCWLSLCPKPELPFSGSTGIRRLVSSSFLNNPGNHGTYSLQYLTPAGTFVADLNITNDGVYLTSDNTVRQFKPPFDQGFHEFSYHLEATTNIADFIFPAQAVLYKYLPASEAKSRDDVRSSIVARFQLNKITLELQHLTTFPVLLALDQRPTNLPAGITVNYRVTNEQWASVSDTNIRHLASLYRKVTRIDPKLPNHISSFFAITLVTLAFLPPLAFILWRRQTKQKGKTTV